MKAFCDSKLFKRKPLVVFQEVFKVLAGDRFDAAKVLAVQPVFSVRRFHHAGQFHKGHLGDWHFII